MLRLTSKLVVSNLRTVQRRCLHSSSALLKAEIFAMPAMSPTMNEGGVTEWKFKEGDSFSAGDILLEVETDKSQIDVEAQDDGILAKIIKSDGSKDIPVGEAIAIIAEPGDDLATLELPEIKSKSDKKEPVTNEEPASKKEEPKKSAPPPASSAPSSSTEANPKQEFSPSVASLLEANSISKEVALSKIRASGPNGRILKCDVLAHLGRISQDSVSKVSSFINSHKHLDLSNIEKLKIRPKEIPKQTEAEKKQEKPKNKVKIIKENFLLTNFDPDFSFGSGSLIERIKLASKRSQQYAYQNARIASDHYDPLFEDLVALPSTLERFTVELNFKEGSPITFDYKKDYVDFLESGKGPLLEDYVDVKVTINPKVPDAEEKANEYISKFKSFFE